MVSPSATEKLRASVRGRCFCPGEQGYDEARKIHNAMIDRRPAIIVQCAGVADVIAAVKFAREHDVAASVRGTGHNVSGTSLCEEGLTIDLSALKGIHVNPRTPTARVEAGVTWAEVNQELQVFGLAAPGGYVGTTGVGGLTLGGGLGWMVRKHGCALDNLLSADVVTPMAKSSRPVRRRTRIFFGAFAGAAGTSASSPRLSSRFTQRERCWPG